MVANIQMELLEDSQPIWDMVGILINQTSEVDKIPQEVRVVAI